MMSKEARGMELVGVSSAIKYFWAVYWPKRRWSGMECPAVENCCKLRDAPSARPWICDGSLYLFGNVPLCALVCPPS
eukprot:7189033-Pyramimonas_sp.AAC.1